MNFSKEELFYQFGQFDKVFGITFRFNSESYNTIGEFIVGELQYSPQERKDLQHLISLMPLKRSDGYQKFRENIDKIIKEKKDILEKKGFLCSDVIEVLGSRFQSVNEYKTTETRELPDPIKIPISIDHTGEELANLIIYYSDSLLKSKHVMAPFEVNQFHGALWYKFKDSIPEEDKKCIFYQEHSNKLKEEIYFEYLDIKFESDELNDDTEKADFDSLFKKLIQSRIDILKNEFEKGTKAIKELSKRYPKEVSLLSKVCIYFKPERLIHGKFPVYVDFERFIHIYLRHVSEAQISERFKNKSKFQYKLKDIRRLMNAVLNEIKNEIQEHFKKHPDKDFKRHGEMSVYYQGDYYVIHISKKGSLMTFYKKT